ncbi:MAG: hypothetical protein AAGA60_32545 [Cyanobacteria bacterium P01_E01_bin.42]
MPERRSDRADGERVKFVAIACELKGISRRSVYGWWGDRDRPETVIKNYTGLKDMKPEEMPILY